MSEVTITINNRNYGISCDDGQEARVAELGNYIDTKLKEIAGSGASTTESHLLVLTSLVLADELQDVKAQLNNVPDQPIVQQGMSEEDQQMLGNAVEHLNQRVLQIANRLKDLA